MTVQDAGRAIVDVVRSLDGAGLMPEWLTVREPTLDDVFLQLTGRRADEAGEAGEYQTTDAGRDGSRREAKRGAA